ncbi:MAG TPA: CBS domain-containing protein [Casimicrobiaceae bacterium]|nr:CBS domain-containing protein [Casimicrobiaceae bacterium]
MLIGDVCKRDVVCAAGDTTVATAAKLMRAHHVGDVVVVDRQDAERMPIGIVTDRDIVIEVLALDVDPTSVKLSDLVSWGQLATVQETDTDADTLRRMHDKGVRRMPVVNGAGVLVGIISIDDFLPRFVSELAELADLVERSTQRERQTRELSTQKAAK